MIRRGLERSVQADSQIGERRVEALPALSEAGSELSAARDTTYDFHTVPTYLYGDSQPFPDGYDFLAELRSFVAAASQALQLAYEADELEESLGDRAQEHLHAIEAIQSFFDNVTNLVADRAARTGAPQVIGPYARELLGQVDAIGARAKQSRAHDLDADSVQVTSSIHERRSNLRSVLSTYLLTDPFRTLSWAMSLNLGGTAPHGQVVLSHPSALTTSFTVDVNGAGDWGRPRKVGELRAGLTLQIGFKKAFLRSSLQPDVHTLDDFYIGDVELGPDSMELHLRRKPGAPRDAFVIELDVDESGASVAKVTKRNDKQGGESEAPHTSEGEEIQVIEQLADALRRECTPLLRQKRRLVFAQLDGHDVFERGLVRQLFERAVARMAPIAAQVAMHSPNPAELSLKVEREGGRREEIYLRKQELVDVVAPLPPEAQVLFEPLGFLPPRGRSSPPSVPPPPGRRL